MIEWIPGSVDHIADLAPRLREADRLECELFGMSSAEALRVSFELSLDSRTVFVDGVPAAALGLCCHNKLGGVGQPWLLTTPLVEQHKLLFVKESRRFVRSCLDIFPCLQTVVDARYTQAIRWLQRMGFSITPVAEHGCVFVEIRR